METPIQEAQRALAPPKSFADTWVATDRPHVWQEKEFSFGDFLDIINPLQHIPVVNTIYRALTGDQIGNVPRVIGDGLFGGPIGLVTGLVQMALKEETGKDVGEHVMALMIGDPASDSAVAAKKPDGETTPEAAEAAPPTPAPAAAAPAAEPQPVEVAEPAKTRAVDPPAAAPKPVAAAVPAKAPASVLPARALPVGQAPVTNHMMPLAAARRPAGDSDAGRQLSNKVVPLQVHLPTTPARVSAPLAFGPATGPIDVPQRMMNALDKYMQMQQERNSRGADPRGGRVDLSE